MCPATCLQFGDKIEWFFLLLLCIIIINTREFVTGVCSY